jgi:hypothetical protein
VLDPEGLSEAHLGTSTANNELGLPKKALTAADACIAMSYINVGCHVQRVISLLALKRHSDAKATLVRVDRLLKHRLESSRRELQAARNPPERELLSARIENFEALQSQAQSLREQHFPQ